LAEDISVGEEQNQCHHSDTGKPILLAV